MTPDDEGDCAGATNASAAPAARRFKVCCGNQLLVGVDGESIVDSSGTRACRCLGHAMTSNVVCARPLRLT